MGLRAVMSIEGINERKTFGNHVMEMEQILGIEAARTCMSMFIMTWPIME
ncbi:hypothetical protein COLO4_24414 [Corchorus olitorius]|uniref:Uncharacterized protein n=1 Tax=Corchorus olitorius TaxID=93759 RepID=A0A1R3IAA3_9ROSI|nr:hypothetical protein COLO4_24414 [Corchorus olitorius]